MPPRIKSFKCRSRFLMDHHQRARLTFVRRSIAAFAHEKKRMKANKKRGQSAKAQPKRLRG